MSAYSKSRRNGRKKKLIKPLVASSHVVSTGNEKSSARQSQTSATPPPVARFRTTSLKELVKEKVTQASIDVSQVKDVSNDFTQDDLVKYWIEYADSLTSEKIHLKNTLNSCKPILNENFVFEVAVYNPSQKDEVFESSALILGYLSGKLNNNRIKMDIRIVEKDEIEMIYTAAEKYAYLSKKNPIVEKLREAFNLVTE